MLYSMKHHVHSQHRSSSLPGFCCSNNDGNCFLLPQSVKAKGALQTKICWLKAQNCKTGIISVRVAAFRKLLYDSFLQKICHNKFCIIVRCSIFSWHANHSLERAQAHNRTFSKSAFTFSKCFVVPMFFWWRNFCQHRSINKGYRYVYLSFIEVKKKRP